MPNQSLQRTAASSVAPWGRRRPGPRPLSWVVRPAAFGGVPMHNESSPNERWGWKFTYKGEELLPFARRRLAQHQAKESELRENLSRMIKDPASFHDDAKLQQLKRD